jgi:CheY-like chemotaxis protein
MSHELRTPLQAILGYASMLERGTARDPAKAIAAIVRNAAAQTRLIEDILDVSRITSGKLRLSMSRIDLAGVVRVALESMRPTALARRIQLVESLPADLGDVYGDFERLQQIVWNLLSNAVKFSEPGGLVEVRGERAGLALRVVVRDTGQGIPPEHLSIIFERFRQLDSSPTRQRGGLGLGLAIVRYLVEAHGGTVGAESAGQGMGATFTVSLPACRDGFARDDAAHERRPVVEPRPLQGIRVLVVDDDDDTREILRVMLSEEGASVISASSAAEALVQLQAEPPHVLISDIGMPFEDGFSLLRRVRSLPPERGGDVPAIALTAYTRREDARAAEDAGFQLHVVKPIRPEQLLQAVRSCVRARSGAAPAGS